jgi:RNA polymerase sigma factor (sigma-70 family)
MLDQRRVEAQPDEHREQLFTERYESLHAWALHLTNHQTDAADDLVQDAFVQWVLGRTRLEEIENIDGYLRTMLRNMHFARISRSAQRLHETALSIADYDSCQLGWTAVEPPRRMQASEELHQICAYACFRKESSKAASVLILRFFHNYFPTEIAGVLNSSRNSVDQWQRLARREAKLFLNRPAGLRFVNGHAPAKRHPVRYLKSDYDLMLDLRELIFSSCHGDCLSAQELETTYANGHDETLTTARLAHIVSCPMCLDAVNVFLGLPCLAERYRGDASDTKQPPADMTGGGASGSGPTELPKKFARRLRETREHKPHELRIAVNGVHVSSLKINSELSELDLKLTTDDPVDFVEISSEQCIQLLFLSINSKPPQGTQWALIELSEGRCLEASYEEFDGPSLHVTYKDPTLDEAYITGETPDIDALSSPLTVVPAVNVVPESHVGAQRGLRAWVERFTNTLRAARERSLFANESEETTKPDGLREVPVLGLFRESGSRGNSRWRLALIVLACVAVIAAFLYLKARLSRELSATMLLERAAAAETANDTAAQVSHRVITLEERRSAEGAIVARRRIEIWQQGSDRTSARRLYDDGNQLIAGVWQKPDGSRAVFHHGAKPRPEIAPASPDDLLLNLDDVWQLEPSAQSFRDLIGAPAGAEVEERATTYVLSYRKERTIGASRLLRAALTLSKSDLHAIEQTLVVQRGGDLHEYRFAEASFELLPQKAVAPAVFEMEPGLIGGATEPRRPGDWALRSLTSNRVPPSPSTSTPPAASAELEVDVAYLLNRAKADRNEQVTLTRSVGGSLRVEGVVESRQRKEEFLKALAPVINNPAVNIEIRTVAEGMPRRSAPSSVSVQEAEETSDRVAADQELRAYFEQKNPSGPTDEAVRSYSSRVVNRAYRALFHAIELNKLVSRFANVDMRTVAPDAREKWLAMLREHAAAMDRETAALRDEIQPVFFPSASPPAPERFSIDSDADLARAVERLHRFALSNNEAVRSAFTTSSQSSAVAVKSLAFWQAMWRVEELAKHIEHYDP